jgi:hypothetical protein
MEGIKNDWASGVYQDPDDAVKSTCRNANALGEMHALLVIYQLDFESMKEFLDESDEPVGTEATGPSGPSEPV